MGRGRSTTAPQAPAIAADETLNLLSAPDPAREDEDAASVEEQAIGDARARVAAEGDASLLAANRGRGEEHAFAEWRAGLRKQ